ncbi:MAG: TonB family protein [Verrucomicrobiota bacterium]
MSVFSQVTRLFLFPLVCVCLIGVGCTASKRQAERVDGFVKVMITMSPMGKLTDAKVVESNAPQELQDYVLNHVRKEWRAKPRLRLKDGRAVESRYVVPVRFRFVKSAQGAQLDEMVVTPP